MNYELAKKLKDAGFPQNLSGGQMVGISGSLAPFIGEFYVPTLSELIEACGNDFREMYRADKSGESIWVAKCCDVTSHKGEGSTPEEAVAELYLALNKK